MHPNKPPIGTKTAFFRPLKNKTVNLHSTSFHKTACCRLPAYRQAGVVQIIFLLIQNLQRLCQPILNTNKPFNGF